MVAGAAAPAVSNVATDEQDGRNRDRGRAVRGEEEAAGERRQRVRGVLEGEELPPGVTRQVLA